MFCMKSTKTKVCLSSLHSNVQYLLIHLFHFYLCGIEHLCNLLLAGFEILAFPCNQFAGQEPGNNDEIQEVACTMFKAEFPIFDKVIQHKWKKIMMFFFLAICMCSFIVQFEYFLVWQILKSAAFLSNHFLIYFFIVSCIERKNKKKRRSKWN